VSAMTLFRDLATRSSSRSGQTSIISTFACYLYINPPEDDFKIVADPNPLHLAL